MRLSVDSKIFPLLSLFICARSFNPFDDGQYDISWRGPVKLNEGQVSPNEEDLSSSKESIVMITKDNEKYKCILPEYKPQRESGKSEVGPDPDELLKGLVIRGECSYRLDTYWTYELCHGRHVKQFHEVKAGVVDNQVQEYYLGRLEPKVIHTKNEGKDKPLVQPPTQGSGRSDKNVPMRKIDGHEFPFYKVVMTNGTPCDLLGNKPRMTFVVYMCNPRSSNEIISVKELQTCQYEVEVFTPLLCANPAYMYHEKPVHQINCHSLDGSPSPPRSYSELLDDQFSLDSFMPEGASDDNTKAGPGDEYREILPKPDALLTAAFLQGEHCLVGGGSVSWWKYKFCYGKQVIQFHEDGSGPRIDILLGKWDQEAHIQWKKNRKKITASYTDHLYSDGEFCDITGKPRTVQVRLKCKESKHEQEVSLSLTEPKTCEYVLTVESPIICPLLEKMDENGIFQVDNV
ncbi:endoplasmic reticulum lectin 1-like [Montipora capricornis]|uniref:endoplasmic reticulum lectin 1-like n=1 Tax=Montipora capricornis TaxID=246305 RepID=UPI0035F17BAF